MVKNTNDEVNKEVDEARLNVLPTEYLPKDSVYLLCSEIISNN